jgi:enoyl-CoA hydratase/carnithine racemase
MTFENILTARDGAAYIITLNRPKKRNAVSLQTMADIIAAMKEAEADEKIRAVILTGGTEFFSAGADLNDAIQVTSASKGIKYFNSWHHLNDTLEHLTKPIIAAIEGFCMTGGCELALACDIRVASKGSTFAITSSKIGTVAGAGGTQRLPRVVGPAKALEIMFAGDPIEAEEAHRIGLINRLVEKGEAVNEAKRMIKVYEKRAPMSLALIKRSVHRGMQMDLASAIEFETFLVSTIYTTKDKHEGISAFLEKREAKFTGN